jgi:LPS-assembly lipoprotein
MTRRRLALLLPVVAAALAGCGFQPLYGRPGGAGPDSASVADEMAAIKIEFIDNRSGQILRNFLLDGMTPRGEPARPTYRLQIALAEPRPQDLGIARDDSVVRFSYNVRALFRLLDARSGRVVYEDSASSSSSYEVTNSQYATVASRDNARERVLEDLALEIRTQIGQYLRERRAASAQ